MKFKKICKSFLHEEVFKKPYIKNFSNLTSKPMGSTLTTPGTIRVNDLEEEQQDVFVSWIYLRVYHAARQSILKGQSHQIKFVKKFNGK